MDHKKYIQMTLELALNARRKGNHPFGALLVHNDSILLTSENTVVTNNDVTQHAELNLVKLAYQRLTKETIKSCTLYTSTEPCAMCAGAIFWSGIRKIVYGLPAKALGEITTGSFVVESSVIFSFAKDEVQVDGPYLLEESKEVHSGFW